MFSGEERNMRFLKNTCANMESSSRASEATKDCTNTDCCDDCVQLENRLRLASEHYLTLIVQRDRENWSGNRDISALDHAIRQARRRRNAAGRLLLYHRINHEILSRPNACAAGQS
jgi:hypothetical protein